ncbi:MAG: DegT/DnrJ/EryC1/StrS family aminotransferase, partial [Muribaculaceae bacterium]
MVPLFKPFMPAQLPELETILHSGQLSYGKYTHRFEADLASYIGIDSVLCTNSFNTAWLVAIAALELKPGDEVIASPLCCLASSQPLAVARLKVVWADIDPNTGTLDPDAVRAKITHRTRAIVHNHFCGYVGHIGPMKQLASQYGLLLIDDVSEAFGSLYLKRKAGNWGADATIYSFQTVRIPNAIDGGAVSFANPLHTHKATLIRDYGIDRSRFRDDLGEISPMCDISIPAYGCLMSYPNAYICYLSL